MSLQRASAPPLRAGRPRRIGYSGARMPRFVPLLAVLILLEAIALTVAVDISPLAERTGLSAFAVAGGGLVPLLFIAPLVFIALDDEPLRALATELAAAPVPLARGLAALIVHLMTFGVFTYGTVALVNAEQPTAAGVALWCLAAAAVPAVGWGVARPQARLGLLVRRAAPALALGTGIAVFVWAMGQVSVRLWSQLYPMVLVPVHMVLQVTLTDVVYQPELQNVGTERFMVNIAPQCSGLEGLGLLVGFAATLIFIRPSAWGFRRALVLFAGAALSAWVANVVRITALVALGDAGWAAVAVGGFHSKAGWVLYSLVGLAMLVGLSRNEAPARDADDGSTSTDAFVGPIVAFTAVGFITGLAAVTTFDPWYGLRAGAGGLALWFSWRAFRTRRLRLADADAAGAPGLAVGLGVVAYGVWLLLAPGPVSPALTEGLAQLSGVGAVMWVFVRVVSAVVVVPWVEELAFRGYLMRRLIRAEFTEVPYGHLSPLAALGSAVAFGAVHQALIAGIIAGLLFAVAQVVGRRLTDAVIAHATTNFLLAAQAFVTT